MPLVPNAHDHWRRYLCVIRRRTTSKILVTKSKGRAGGEQREKRLRVVHGRDGEWGRGSEGWRADQREREHPADQDLSLQ